MNAQLGARWVWLLVGGAALGCLSSLDERNLDGEGEAGEGGTGATSAAGSGGTTSNGGTAGSAPGSAGAAGTATSGGSAGSGSGAIGGNASGGTSGSGRGGDAASQNGGTDAGTTGTTGDSGMGGGGAGGTAGSGGSEPGGSGSGGGAGTGGDMAGSAGNGGTNVGGAGNGGSNVGGGGSGGTDGSPSCGTSWAAGLRGYVTSPGASGCWRGHAYTGIGGNGTIDPLNFDACGQTCDVCIDGTLYGNETYSSFAVLGVNLNQALDSVTRHSIVPEATTLTISFTNPTSAAVRLELEPLGGGDAWCYELPWQGTLTIPYATFRTNCWDTSGSAYAGEPIASVRLVVPGGYTGMTQPYELCITELIDG